MAREKVKIIKKCPVCGCPDKFLAISDASLVYCRNCGCVYKEVISKAVDWKEGGEE